MQSAPADISRSLLADCYNRIADCHYYQTDFTSAAEAYNKAYDLNPSSGDYALYQLAIMKGLRKDHAGKIESIDALSERFPHRASYPTPCSKKPKASQRSARPTRR